MATATQFSVDFDPGFTPSASARALQFAGAPAPEVVIPPWVEVLSPTSGSVIGPSDELVIEVYPATANVKLSAGFADGSSEPVHDGTAFTSQYSTSSRVTTSSGTYVFTIRRTGGWVSAPSLTAFITTE